MKKWRIAVKKLDDGTHVHLCVWWDEPAEAHFRLRARRPDISCEKCRVWAVDLEIIDRVTDELPDF